MALLDEKHLEEIMERISESEQDNALLLVAKWRADAKDLIRMSKDGNLSSRTSQVRCYQQAMTLRQCARELKRLLR